MPLSQKNNMPTLTKKSASKKAATKKAASKGSEKPNDSLLEKFFEDELKDIYWAEKHLVKTLPKMKKAATTPELQDAIAMHLEETKEHVSRLEQVFEMLGKKPQAKKCDAMAGITEEGDGVIEDTEEGTATRDVALIMAAQKVEHYEIATYGGLATLATTLGYDDAADLLKATLAEEKEADEKLTEIAENDINYQSSQEEEDEEE
jgi:ferritin-like metal-binding protein YciE